MNVCLIYPTLQNWEPWPPLGLAYIASFIRKKCSNITIIDRNVLLRDNRNDLIKADLCTVDILKRNPPDVVGITATTPLIFDAYKVAKLVKDNLPHSKTILGGTHATVLPKEVLKECPHLDFVCVGEGEIVFDKLISSNGDVSKIDGLAYRREDEIVINNFSPLIENLDELPFPARDLIDMTKYLEQTNIVIRGLHIRATHIFGARGCPYKCRFCASSAVFGGKIRFHSPQYLVNEIKHLITTYNIKGLYFAEDMFLSNKKRALELCQLLIKENLNKEIKWCAQLKTNIVDQEFLEELKKAGCIQIEYGFESGSDRTLKLMDKKTTVAINCKAAELTRKSKMRFLANIIVGTPEERIKDFSETINFIKEIKADYVAFNKFIPLPGSDFYEELNKKGVLSNDWESYWTTSLDYNFTDIPKKVFILKYLYHRFIITFKNTINYYSFNLKKGNLSIFNVILRLFKQPDLKLKKLLNLGKRIISSLIKR